ncbi:hypothetical protein DPV80_03185 [Haemophilus sputorum]|uniref:Uncharacterized protein n=1 Tax=Haemophilus sputorum TaxID=1078480 RepID=A0ABX9HUM2_9PAST|nr:hypothetical protein DPV80_03185 [Haemophilus sputorum]RDF12555.1 hypothetical protein DPV84_03185 [Haemophilus sputorum]
MVKPNLLLKLKRVNVILLYTHKNNMPNLKGMQVILDDIERIKCAVEKKAEFISKFSLLKLVIKHQLDYQIR